MGLQSTYAYRARDPQGRMIEGSMTATSADEVGTRLRNEGKIVLHVGEHALTKSVKVDSGAIRRNESAKRVKRDDVIAFSQQMGVMMETGVPLDEALESFRRQQRNAAFDLVLRSIADDICAGEPLSATFAKWPRVFPSIMVSLMKASEASGTMSSMLVRIGEYLSVERRTVKQIKGALTYPIFMLTFGLGITVFLVAIVLPRFARIYEQRSASLPTPTRLLLAGSDFLISYAYLYVPALLVLGVAFAMWRHTDSGRRILDWLRLNTPIIRQLYRQVYLTRAARTMSTLLVAGVGLLDIIDICRGVTRNYYWERLWNETDTLVRNGQQVSEAFAASRVIPPGVVSMISAGERSGRLSAVMDRIATFADEELTAAVKQVTSFIEPVMITVMGVVIGGVALALLLPIFTIGNVMSGQ